MRWINRKPDHVSQIILALLSFMIILVVYTLTSQARLAVNPSDKLMPAISKIIETAGRLIFEPDKRSGEILFWKDSLVSLVRICIGIIIAGVSGLFFGMAIGMIPYIRAALSPLVKVISVVPPLALLPIMFIALGLGETSKITLIVIGVTPFIIRDLIARVDEIPVEQIVKAQTLGANTFVIAKSVVLPQIMPRLVSAIRLSLGPAWLFLIAAEAVAAEAGLGYRIFLVRRYLAMDVILTYVIWISFLAFVMDWVLRKTSENLWPWMESKS